MNIFIFFNYAAEGQHEQIIVINIYLTILRQTINETLIHISIDIERGYYMAGRRYETFLQVLKNISQVSAVNTRTEISFLQAAI